MIKIFKSLKNNQKNTNNVYAVVNGVSFNLEYVDDNVFSKKVMGEGVAIVPTSSEVCAPCAGVLTTLFPTGHAFGITRDDGVEILVHIGLDTVNLKGKGFTILKKKNQKVGAGEKIIKLDLNYLRNENKNFKVGLRNNEALCYDFSFDRWMIEMFIKQYGKEDALRILRGLNTIPYVTVRVNTCKADYDEVYERLEEEGYDIEEGAFSPEAIIIKKGSAIEKNKLYQEGLITVQDESAMLVAPLFDLRGDEQVMDLCSAPGTKATHIGELMMNKGKVVAFDIHDHKLALIKENIDRLGLTNVEVELGDATKINSKYINWADRVLLDVPCSGLGIIRKKPEIKWNKKNNDLTEVVKVQKEILKNAWNYLREGGELVYSTCTLNKKENEEVIDWFVERNSDCEVEKVFLGKADNVVYNDNGSVTILPNKYMDGFFIAKLKKKESK